MANPTQKQRSQEKRQYWQAHMEAWQQSGQTRGAYCEQHGLNLKTFAYWRHRFKTENTAVKLVQLPAEALPAGPALRVVVDNRIAIEVSDGFTPATLTRVIEAVRGR